jgi:diaminopimelate decarboxylase
MESLVSLTWQEARELRERFGTPLYLYDEALLTQAAKEALAFPQAYGLTVRYAMKASPNRSILRLFASLGLHFDASSGYEVKRLQAAGIPLEKVSLSTQELPADFAELIRAGVHLNACSLSQLEAYGKAFPGSEVGVRFNPGLGSGGTNRTNVGGPGSSFGIWHEQLPEVKAVLERYKLTAIRFHSHIGSGSDPAVWQKVAGMNLELVRQLPTVKTLNLGGGFKVARVPGEKTTDLQLIGAPVKAQFEAFAAETGRQLHLELEPGTYLVARAGAVLSTIQDVVSTGVEGNTFYKLDTGMTDLLRPSLYGAQHGMTVISAESPAESCPVLVVGHCCESGDILTPAPGEPEVLGPRSLPAAAIGDFLLITGTGAYCAAMPAKNYNSFPESPEVLRQTDGSFRLIRARQTVESIWANEL